MRGGHSRAAAVNSLPKRAAGSISSLCLKLAPSKPSKREESGGIVPSEQVKQIKHPERASRHLLAVGEGNWPFQDEIHLISCRFSFGIT